MLPYYRLLLVIISIISIQVVKKLLKLTDTTRKILLFMISTFFIKSLIISDYDFHLKLFYLS